MDHSSQSPREENGMIPADVINWLLEPENPSTKHRTMKELLGESKYEVHEIRNLILSSDSVKTLFEKMHPDGYWLQKNPRTGEVTGDGVKYSDYATTHFCLSYLAELGLDRNHPKVAKAARAFTNRLPVLTTLKYPRKELRLTCHLCLRKSMIGTPTTIRRTGVP